MPFHNRNYRAFNQFLAGRDIGDDNLMERPLFPPDAALSANSPKFAYRALFVPYPIDNQIGAK